MTSATALSACLFCVCLCSSAEKGAAPVVACNPKGISAAGRPRHRDLAQHLRSAIQRRAGIPDGYAYTLNGKNIALPEVAEWISLERLCCPFLTFRLSASGSQADWVLMIVGPHGVKPLLDAEFPGR